MLTDITDNVDSLKAQLEMEIKDPQEAADELVAYTKNVQDPFHPDYTGDNEWVGGKGGGGGGCAIL